MGIGHRLREARLRTGLSLRGLGALTGFSASFLSQVELGQASPSLGSLTRIAEALGLTPSALLADGEPSGLVQRRAKRKAHRSEWSRATMESLVPATADDALQATLLRLDAGGRTGAIACGSGTRLFAYCVSGSATLALRDPDEALAMSAGDSAVIDGPRTLAWESHGEAPVELVTVIARTGGAGRAARTPRST